jgi:hypothetical protein
MSSSSDITAAIKRKIIRFENGDTSHPKGTYTQDNSYRLSLAQQTKDCCPVVVEEGISYDIFVAIGQSNAVGVGNQPTALETTPVDGVMQLGRNGDNFNKIIPARDPLEHNYSLVTSGFPFSFARTYKTLTGRNVLLVPCARGATPIQAWAKTDTALAFQANVPANTFRGINLYTEALTRTLTAFNKNANNKICGILWHQGESNSPAAIDQPYFSLLEAFITDFRNDLFANGVPNGLYVPWILGEFVPGWMTLSASLTNNSTQLTRDGINAVASLPNNGWVTSQAISAADPILLSNDQVDGLGDTIHFNTESLRRFGVRYYNVYTNLINGGVSAVTSIVVSPIDISSLSVTFSSTNALVSKYILEYYIDGLLVNSVELKPYDKKYTISNVNYSLTHSVAITPYYNDIKGLTTFGSYPNALAPVSDLNMRIFSADNSTIADQIGGRTITKAAVSGVTVRDVVNIDHNKASRLMYLFNGGYLTVGGDVPAGSYSKSLWIKLSTAISFASNTNRGLIEVALNGNTSAAGFKERLFLYFNGPGTIAVSGSPVANANAMDFEVDQSSWNTTSTSSINRPDKWMHIVLTWDNTAKTRVVYLNSTVIFYRQYVSGDALFTASNDGYFAPTRNADSIRIGATGVATHSMMGWMNDIRYYTKVLSPLEVRNIYAFNG